MNRFFDNIPITLTPLTPIHIGCGEDLEPTHYVIDNNILYRFDPTRVFLEDSLKNQLFALGNKADYLGIQKFFDKNRDHFKPYAKTLIPVPPAFGREYNQKIGQTTQREENGKEVFNRLSIQRTICHPNNDQPYIPGSSLKGAIRTAHLDYLNDGKKPLEKAKESQKLENRLLEIERNNFGQSPFRLLKIADLVPNQGKDIARSITYARNFKKREVLDKKTGLPATPRGLTTRKEVILPAQYRAFTASINLQHLGNIQNTDTPKTDQQLKNIQQIAANINRYNLRGFKQEMEILAHRRLTDPNWQRSIQSLITHELQQVLEEGKAFLIRLGQYGGAESKTLRGDNVAQIKIMQGKQRSPIYQSHTLTVWLSANSETARSEMQPFGWALVEISPETDLSPLKTWCQAETESRKYPDMQAIRKQLAEKQEEILLKKERHLQEKAKQEAKRKAEEIAQQEKEAQRAAMSDVARTIDDLKTLLEKANRPIPAGSQEAAQCRQILEKALTWDNPNDKKELINQINPLLKKTELNSNKKFKPLIRQLRGEE